jgi:hypothetical protein
MANRVGRLHDDEIIHEAKHSIGDGWIISRYDRYPGKGEQCGEARREMFSSTERK